MNPKYPIYVVSRDRWDKRLTSKALEHLGVPYHIIVNKDEYSKYCEVIDKSKVLIMPDKYREEYDMFWKDDVKITGPGAARNFAWDDSIKRGFDYHWVMDDNIERFYRFNKNWKLPVADGTVLKVMEDFTLRYENIALSGPNYDYFVVASNKYPPFTANTRVYSCMFIRNDIPFRWRGRYNEDTDLCIRVLKAGFCTIQFNAFLQDKVPTQINRGGNSSQFYDKEGTYKKSKMLQDMHPEIVKIVKKFNRCHHFVDYRQFRKNKLIKKKGLNIPTISNNYGMKLVDI
jgi:DNA-directed RNA polymerase subunit H (RpoH/RPB5)